MSNNGIAFNSQHRVWFKPRDKGARKYASIKYPGVSLKTYGALVAFIDHDECMERGINPAFRIGKRDYIECLPNGCWEVHRMGCPVKVAEDGSAHMRQAGIQAGIAAFRAAGGSPELDNAVIGAMVAYAEERAHYIAVARGKITTPRKLAALAENRKKGGRPKGSKNKPKA